MKSDAADHLGSTGSQVANYFYSYSTLVLSSILFKTMEWFLMHLDYLLLILPRHRLTMSCITSIRGRGHTCVEFVD